MKYQRLGSSGLKVSELCLGTMTFGHQCDEKTSFAIMDQVAENGVTFIDTADCYPIPLSLETAGRTEEIVGKWLRDKRDRFVLATKCRIEVGPGPNDSGLSRKHILHAVEQSLRRLQTDYIDLYQAHSPDPETPLEETLDAFDTLVRQGKVRYLGLSNFPAWQVALTLGISAQHGWSKIVSVQPRYNVIFREIENGLLPLCRDQNLGVMAYNPLAGGFLTGRYQSLEKEPPPETRFTLGGPTGKTYRQRYWHEAQLEAVNDLQQLMKQNGRSLITASVAWVLAQKGVTCAIIGASKPEQLKATLAAVDFELTEQEVEAFDDAWYRVPRKKT